MTMTMTIKGNMFHTFYRSDFKNTADGDNSSFFDDLLYSAGIPEKDWANINEITIHFAKYEIS